MIMQWLRMMKNLYCSELVYYALQAVNIEVTKTSKILDHEIITPTDIGIFRIIA